ncbi:josephin-like protein [Populus alba x Populus x berolinensis]|nr:josephin-like protein [Populus alba x Populus x berolinensis]
MSRRASKRLSFSPDVNDKPTIFLKHGGGTRVGGNRKKIAGIFSFRLPRTSKFSPARLLRRLGAKVARVLRFVSMGRKSSRKVTSSSLPRSKSLAEAVDSQRAEAIEDCIEFLNSSSSLQRSSIKNLLHTYGVKS